jgi:acetylornithine deacetylase/succinyl-diaminopimelate desuccinylase-like protein
VRKAEVALAAEYGRAPVLQGCGGSIPVVESLRRILGLDSLLIGFGLEDDQVHSPNEKFEWRCFHQGMRSHIRLLGALAQS